MSCYQVNDSTITSIIAAIMKFDPYSKREVSIYGRGGFAMRFDPTDSDRCYWSELGTILKRQNAASVEARYPNHSDMSDKTPFVYDKSEVHWASLTVAQGIKSLDNYEYQACETSDWEDTQAAHLCDILRKKLSGLISGYEEAGWGYDYPTPDKQKAAV